MTMVSAGAKLGPYRIEGFIGKGGMGEVFRALDTRLGRKVAVKILPSDKGIDAERRKRFFQEARAASALNHPNIVTLHDVASQAGLDYMVMELVPGKPLDRLITPKGMPLVEALDYVQQIASGLAAAHAAGIVHRDMKPSNVIVTPDSQVKILDFGLAKLTGLESAGEGETRTLEPALTKAGTVMGTVAYMSPEQAGGKPLDSRSDIFSLGVITFEMLTGRRPFSAGTPLETLHAIVHDPPPPLAGQPPELQEILDRALAKDARERYQHVGDLALDLRRFLKGWETKSLLSLRGTTIASIPRRRMRWATAGAAFVAAGVLVAGGWLLRGREESPENPLANAKFTRVTDFEGIEADPAVSADGKFIAFVSDRDGTSDIWLNRAGTGSFVNLTQGKTSDVRGPLRSVGFTGDGSEIWLSGLTSARMRVMPLMGGPWRTLLTETTVHVAWSPDGSRMVYQTRDSGDPMFVADRTGANPRPILANSTGVHNHFAVWALDSRWIYFVRGRPATGEMDLWRIRPEGGEPERLTQHNRTVAYPAPISTSTVLYVAPAADGSGPWLWAADVERKASRRVSYGLEVYTSLAASADGRRLAAAISNPSASLWSLPISSDPVDETAVRSFALPTVRALAPRFGGTSLFYLSSNGSGDGLWRFSDGQVVELWKGSDGALLEPAAVTRDGSLAAIALRLNGKVRLQILTAGGSPVRTLPDDVDVRGSASWSPDGRWLATGGEGPAGQGLYKIPADGGAPVLLVRGEALDPVWSLDGSVIAYAGPNVSTFVPLLAARPDGTPVRMPEIRLRRSGERVRFLPDGKSLVYMRGEGLSQDFWLLDLTSMRMRPLTRLSNRATMRTFDITPDGKQIIFDRLRENSDIVMIDLPGGGP